MKSHALKLRTTGEHDFAGKFSKAISWLLHHPGSAKKTKRQLHRLERHATRTMLHTLTLD